MSIKDKYTNLESIKDNYINLESIKDNYINLENNSNKCTNSVNNSINSQSNNSNLLRKCGINEFPITKLDNYSKPNFDNMFFTNVIRCLCIGGTGCGKTTLLENIIDQANKINIPFTDLILYAPQMTIDSEKWNEIRNILNKQGKNLVPQPIENYPNKKEYLEMIKKSNYRNEVSNLSGEIKYKNEVNKYKDKLNYKSNSNSYKSKSLEYYNNHPLITPDTIFNTQQKYPDYRPLIVFDDAVSYFKSFPLLVDHYRQYMNNGTRLNIAAVFNLIQALQHLPTDLRNSCSSVIFFPNCISPSQLKVIAKNIKYNILSDPILFNKVIELIKERNNKFDYLTISFDAPMERQVRFNEDLFINPF